MPTSSQALLCRYHYDPLDRLAATASVARPDALRFYQKNRLATEIQGAVRRSIVQHEDLLLAQQQRVDSAVETTLLATDQQRSVLQLLDNTDTQPLTYNPYGHLPADSGLTSLLGFNGEHRDPVTGHYLLGNGYRAFNPVLMRFNSPDSLSPFGEGGVNGYAYCAGDPVNLVDPSGHVPFFDIPRPSLGSGLYKIRVTPTRLLYKGGAIGPFKVKLNRMSPQQYKSEQLQKAVASVNASVIQRGPETQGLRPEFIRIPQLSKDQSIKSAYKRSILDANQEDIYLRLNEYAKAAKKLARPAISRELGRIEDSVGYIRKPPAEASQQEALRRSGRLDRESRGRSLGGNPD